MLRLFAENYEGITVIVGFVLLGLVGVIVTGLAEGWVRLGSRRFRLLVVSSAASAVCLVAIICAGRSEGCRWMALEASESVADYVDFLRDFPEGRHSAEAEAEIRKGQAEVVRLLDEADAGSAAAVLYRGLMSHGPLSTLAIRIVGDRERVLYLHADKQLYAEALDDFEDSAVAIIMEAAALFAPEILEERTEARSETEPPASTAVTIVLSYEVKESGGYEVGGWDSGPVNYPLSAIGITATWAIYYPNETDPRIRGTLDSRPPAIPHWDGVKAPETIIAESVAEGILAGLKGTLSARAQDNAEHHVSQ